MSGPIHRFDPDKELHIPTAEDLQDARLTQIEGQLKQLADAVADLDFRLKDLDRATQIQFSNLKYEYVARR